MTGRRLPCGTPDNIVQRWTEYADGSGSKSYANLNQETYPYKNKTSSIYSQNALCRYVKELAWDRN